MNDIPLKFNHKIYSRYYHMYGHLLPSIEVSRPPSRVSESIKQGKSEDQTQFEQQPETNQQSPEAVNERGPNESTILHPDHSANPYLQPTPNTTAELYPAIPEKVEPEDLTPYKFRLEVDNLLYFMMIF